MPQNSGPNAPPGEAAYQRAWAAFQAGATEDARRFSLEALAEDPDHVGATALLARLDLGQRPSAPKPAVQPTTAAVTPPTAVWPSAPAPGARRAPEPPPMSEDIAPTIVFTRSNRPPDPRPPSRQPEPVRRPEPGRAPEPVRAPETLINPRPDWNARSDWSDQSEAAQTVVMPAQRSSARPAPASLPPPPATRATRPAAAQKTQKKTSWLSLEALTKRWGASQPSRTPRKGDAPKTIGPSLWSQYGQSALIAGGLFVVIVGAALVIYLLSGWIWPPGELLTINKPAGGTIRSAGITCGTGGSDCSTTLPTGEPVELEPVPDDGFAFSGFTGDCAPTGRTAMSGPRTCGANFESIAAGAKAVVWTLTIVPPKGGSILAAGGIQCGSLGSECSADLPDGVPVTLHRVPDDGYTFVSFTDECAPSGQTMMTGPRTCSATFTPVVASVQPSSPAPVNPRPARSAPSVVVDPPSSPRPADPPPVPSGSTSGPASPTTLPPSPPPATTQATITPADPNAKAPITAEEHARTEIPGVFKEYCAGLEALDPVRIQKVFPTANVRDLREQFRQYKTLKCAITGAPEFIQLDAIVGTARVDVGMKQTIEMRSGGAPRVSETIATTALTRPEARSFWRISSVTHKPKPKE